MADAIAILSLGIAAITAYLTLFHRGRLAIVRPSLIVFTRDGGPSGRPKIVTHAMLFSTSYRGNVIESCYAVLHYSDKRFVYPNWNHGEGKTESIVPGSGLFVGKDGISRYHHFLSLDGDAPVSFTPGIYTVELRAIVSGSFKDKCMITIDINVPEQLDGSESLRFDWNPLVRAYQVEAKP